jgi:lipoprotein-releasing system permease protein
MSFEYFVAKKYFKAKRRTGFISLITFVSIIGVVIGVTALILVLSVMNGFEEEVRSKLIGTDAHVRLRKFFNKSITEIDSVLTIIQKYPQVVGASPTIFKEGMIKSRQGQEATFIHAIDLKTVDSISDIREKIRLGSLDFSPREINGRSYPGIVLSEYLADNLFATNIGDLVYLLTFPKDMSIIAPPIKPKIFYVAGIVRFGYYDFDRLMSFIALEDAQTFFEMPGGISYFRIKLKDYMMADDVKEALENDLGYPWVAQTWQEMNKSLFSWMQIEKLGMFVILSLIIMVAAFNIVSSLIMIVMEKTREIGILKSMGATSNMIMKIFMFEGFIIGIIGTGFGLLLGYTLGFLQLKYKIISLPPDVYILTAVPIKMYLADFFAISGVAMFLCLLASVYPAFRASRLEPVEAIRYE